MNCVCVFVQTMDWIHFGARFSTLVFRTSSNPMIASSIKSWTDSRSPLTSSLMSSYRRLTPIPSTPLIIQQRRSVFHVKTNSRNIRSFRTLFWSFVIIISLIHCIRWLKLFTSFVRFLINRWLFSNHSTLSRNIWWRFIYQLRLGLLWLLLLLSVCTYFNGCRIIRKKKNGWN